jgi:X-X-X-Leu-X-X-Gly heptad repeat protein
VAGGPPSHSSASTSPSPSCASCSPRATPPSSPSRSGPQPGSLSCDHPWISRDAAVRGSGHLGRACGRLPPIQEVLRSIGDGSPVAAIQLSRAADRLPRGVSQLSRGASRLSAGVNQLSRGVSQLSCGVSQLSRGVSQLSCGVSQLSCGVSRLSPGISRLPRGVNRFSPGASRSPVAAEGSPAPGPQDDTVLGVPGLLPSAQEPTTVLSRVRRSKFPLGDELAQPLPQCKMTALRISKSGGPAMRGHRANGKVTS